MEEHMFGPDASIGGGGQGGEAVPIPGLPRAAVAPGAALPGSMSHRSQAILQRIGQLLHVLEAAQIDPPSGSKQTRAVAGNALVCICNLIEELRPENPTCVRPLQQLLYALKDLDHGYTGDLLKKCKPRGRASKEVEEVLVRSLISAAMTCLMNAGRKRHDASRDIHRQLQKMGFVFPDRIRKVTSQASYRPGAQVEKWRERIMEEERSGSLADNVYRDALEHVKGLAADRAVLRLLEVTKDCHPSYFSLRP